MGKSRVPKRLADCVYFLLEVKLINILCLNNKERIMYVHCVIFKPAISTTEKNYPEFSSIKYANLTECYDFRNQ